MTYGEDLAFVHDLDFGAPAAVAAGLVQSLAPPPAQVVDLGCGSGVLAALLADAGYQVVGFDPSPHMLELARRRAPRARFECAGAADAELPGGADVVVAVGEILNFAGADLAPVFARVRAALRPGGLFCLDVAGPGRLVRPFAFHDTEQYALVLRAEEEGDGLTRQITVFRPVGDGVYRRSDERHVLRLFDAAEVDAALRAAGFDVLVADPQRHGPGWAAFIAHRP